MFFIKATGQAAMQLQDRPRIHNFFIFLLGSSSFESLWKQSIVHSSVFKYSELMRKKQNGSEEGASTDL